MKGISVMHRKILCGIWFLVPAILLFVSLSGCKTAAGISIGNTPPAPAPAYEEEGPPPWAPAHGNRAKHIYRYYPYHRIYFDEKAGVYFYLINGKWQMSVSLPSSILITVNDFVTLDMDTDKPYKYDNEVVKRYPPGQAKKKDKEQDKDNNKGKKKENKDLIKPKIE
jgi:hypothetical protein